MTRFTPPPPSRRRRRNPRVLLVDDEPAVLRGLKRMLGTTSWSIDCAGDVRQALAQLAVKKFDLVITDLQMPGGSGLKLLAELDKRYPETVRVVHSSRCGATDDGFVKRLAHGVLEKPAGMPALRRTLQWALELGNSVAAHGRTSPRAVD